MNNDGKQLLAEALYLYGFFSFSLQINTTGVMLILLDELIEGVVRERMLISYLRYKVTIGAFIINIRDTQKNLFWMKFVKYVSKQDTLVDRKNLLIIPRNIFKGDQYCLYSYNRIPLSKTAITMIIGRLRSDDIYNQIANYPLPEHRRYIYSSE